ncbi:alpha/beta fold hydrolase [Haloarcula onubensis]|uniref:Alpha/beta hydrolase n=1 Tax=Haloarcula onubensis TaxID=2950539 RepID=A0ABU2FQX6_9EURY|nr:alpha/beta hydrolase [Halomicroarcula sp. S3CR25-11]MDS0282656.1 alpha/beta hydrolase [Halomicroarcula sp. S3CR25-11]
MRHDDPTSDRGAGPFASLYDRARESLLTVDTTETTVETSAGQTAVLQAGDPTAPPLVVLQGGNVTAPVTLAWVQRLADEYRLLAPETPGEPARTRTEPPASYGRWVTDVFDGLCIDRAPAVGISHGGGVLLEAAAHAPDRIAAAALVVPAGFGVSPSLSLARVVGLSLLYRLRPSERVLDAALSPLFTESVDGVAPVVRETVATALRTADLRAEFPGPEGPQALARFDAPTLVAGAGRDPFFPAAWLHERAGEYLPGATHRTLARERHFLSPTGQASVVSQCRSLLRDVS